MGTWQLFVDESGGFTQGATGVVAGLLVRGRDTEDSRHALRTLLEGVTPGVPWPPHASTLNIAAAWAVLGCEGAGSGLEALDLPRSGTAEAQRRSILVRLDEARARGRWHPPDQRVREVMSAVDAWLREHARASYGALAALRDRNDRLRIEAHRALGACVAGGPFAAVGAWGVGADPATLPAKSDGYLQRLGVLVERAVAALRLTATPSRHTLLVYVATRDVTRHGGAPESMTAANVRCALEDITRPRVVPEVTVDVVPMPPQRFDAYVHPGIVVADHLANRLARVLSGAHERTWDQVAARVVDATGLRCELRTRPGDLPMIAVDGEFRASLRDHWHTGASPAVPDVPPWARGQHDAWCAAT